MSRELIIVTVPAVGQASSGRNTLRMHELSAGQEVAAKAMVFCGDSWLGLICQAADLPPPSHPTFSSLASLLFSSLPLIPPSHPSSLLFSSLLIPLSSHSHPPLIPPSHPSLRLFSAHSLLYLLNESASQLRNRALLSLVTCLITRRLGVVNEGDADSRGSAVVLHTANQAESSWDWVMHLTRDFGTVIVDVSLETRGTEPRHNRLTSSSSTEKNRNLGISSTIQSKEE
ncbi:unnamed protein product [Pleuronectes platessa]|uniref:Uncharacterized protein n=1 Tax=Pleuronectes platessa TaxID=8262 RepID=A0A9N7YPP4_PLEPL|nr:unnamed protein product [Pleuronectes platessa]